MVFARIFNKTKKIVKRTRQTLLQKMGPTMVSAQTLSDETFLAKFNVDGVSSRLKKGDTIAAREEISKLPWVSHLDEKLTNNTVQWRIAVSDPEKAKRDLLPILVNKEQMTVLNFGRQERELEDVFMQLVSGGNHGK